MRAVRTSARRSGLAAGWRRVAVLALLLAPVALATCTSSPGSSRAPGARSSVTPTGRVSRDGREGFAVWPEDTLRAAEASLERLASGVDPWRADPRETALRFVERVLGWTDAVGGEPIDRGEGMEAVEVRSASAGASVEVLVARLLEPWWWVHAVHGGLGHDPVVSVSGSVVRVGVDAAGAVGTDVEVGYGGREVRGSLSGSGELRLRLGYRPATTGHLLILARDAGGRVIGAFASPLPAGDFAAG